MVGAGTTIGAFTHISPLARIGESCEIGDNVTIADGVVLQDRVKMGNGAHVTGPGVIENDVVIGPNATITVELSPAEQQASSSSPTTISQFVRIGANATIVSGITIGRNATVRPSTVVTRIVPANAIVSGNPAEITGYERSEQQPVPSAMSPAADPELRPLSVKGAGLHQLPLVEDLRGALVFGEIDQHLPFTPDRFFVIFDVPNREIRGEHAHRELHEFLVCLRGSCAFALDDAHNREEVILSEPTIGLHVPPMVWRAHYRYTPDAVLLSLCSARYDPDDYIRDYATFLAVIAEQGD